MNREPTDAEVIKAAVNVLTAEAELRTRPDQKREKGQSAFRREFVAWAELNDQPCFSTQFFSQAIRDRRIGVPAAHVIRRFYQLSPEAFVERFGKDAQSAADALRINGKNRVTGMPTVASEEERAKATPNVVHALTGERKQAKEKRVRSPRKRGRSR